MASSSKETKLTLTTDVKGQEEVDALGKSFVDLAATGKDSEAAFSATSAAVERMRAELTALSAATKEQRAAEAAAAAAVREAGRALNEQKDARAKLRAEAKAGNVDNEKFKADELALTRAIIDGAAAMRVKRDAQTAAATSARVAAAAENALANEIRATAAASTSSAQRQIANNAALQESVAKVGAQLRQVQTLATAAIGGSFIGSLGKDLADTADEAANLAARIKLVTGEGPAFQTAFNGVAAIAIRTNSALDETATLLARLSKAGTDAGMSAGAAQAQALALTETINQAVQLSGSSADASKAAVTQLIQGLQSGVLRGEEFNSVLEQAPRLAQALATGLNVTTGELRRMAEQGSLTSDVVIKSLRGQADTVAAEFGKLPPTVGRALQNLSTQWTLYVGAADNGMVSSRNAAAVIDGLAKNLDVLVSTLGSAGKALAVYKIAGLAGDALKWAAATLTATEATVASTAAVAANTVVTTANTAAKAANASAAVASGAAIASSAGEVAKAGIVWRGFTALFGPLGFAVAALGPEIVGLARSAGEAAAKWAGWGKVLEANEAKLKAQDQAAADLAESHRRLVVATTDASDAQFGLSKGAAGAIATFDELRKKGDSAADAINKIGKDFDLTSAPGIRDAAGVLDKLLDVGKLTAAEFQAAWAKALDGHDLLQFETRARAALAGTARETQRLAEVMDATLREAVKRTGLEWTLLEGNVGAASRSAINDVHLIARSLASLSAKGIDTGRVLTASLSKAIDTADSEKALAALQTQIEQVRTKLGDKVADGLLDQAAQKAMALKDAVDQATPGITSIREAYKQLGITAPEELDRIAKANKAAWSAIREDGNSSADTLKKAFAVYAESAVAASGKVDGASKALTQSLLQNEASAKGLEVTFDASGRAMVRAIGDADAAVDKLGKSYGRLGDAAVSAADRATTALERQNAQAERANAAAEKAIDLENKRRGVDSSGFAADKSGQRINMGGDLTTRTGIMNFLKSAGVTDDEAAKHITNEFADGQGNVIYSNNPGQIKYGGTASTISEALLKAAERYTFAPTSSATKAPAVGNPAAGGSKTINVVINGKPTAINVASAADGDNLTSVIRQLETAARGTS